MNSKCGEFSQDFVRIDSEQTHMAIAAKQSVIVCSRADHWSVRGGVSSSVQTHIQVNIFLVKEYFLPYVTEKIHE